jgi:hypothetical protein
VPVDVKVSDCEAGWVGRVGGVGAGVRKAPTGSGEAAGATGDGWEFVNVVGLVRTLFPDVVSVSPLAATMVAVNEAVDGLVITASMWKVLRPRCVTCAVPSTTKVGLTGSTMPTPDADVTLKGRSVPLGPARAAPVLTAAIADTTLEGRDPRNHR